MDKYRSKSYENTPFNEEINDPIQMVLLKFKFFVYLSIDINTFSIHNKINTIIER